jgi:lipopolysaccharide export system permease protein
LLRLVDKYILKQIILTLVFALVALCVIFIVINFMEKMDDFMDNKVTWQTIVKYYFVYLPEILKILTPVSILLACLFTVGRLSNNNEITAMKSGGMSLYRLITPIALLGILLSAGQYYFNGWIVPTANEEKERISQEDLKQTYSEKSVNNLALRDSPNRNILMQYYDTRIKKGFKILIEEFLNNNDKLIIVKKIEAKNILWIDETQSWILNDVIVRNVKNQNEVIAERYEKLPIDLNIKHKQIVKINKKANEMNFDEMEEYINVLKNGGRDVRKLEIEYNAAKALPMANFIVILFAVSFASVKKRGGLAVQIAAAMIIAFSYLIFFEISKPIGLSMNISPIIVGWSANIIFLISGIVSIFKTRT